MAQISTSDLRGLLPHHFQLLGLPVLEFLAHSLGGQEPPPTSLTQTFGVKSPRKATRDVHVETCSMQVKLLRISCVPGSGRQGLCLGVPGLLQLQHGGWVLLCMCLDLKASICHHEGSCPI